MLSDELRSLKEWWETVRHGTHEMTDRGAQAFALALDDCIEQAVAMEAALPMSDMLLGDAPESITDEMLAQARLIADATNVVLLYTSRPPFTDGSRGGAA
jgi:hypothetical protein